MTQKIPKQLIEYLLEERNNQEMPSGDLDWWIEVLENINSEKETIPVNNSPPIYSQPEQPTLRDYFAARALHGYMDCWKMGGEPPEFANAIARDCYFIANAMLAEREKGK